MSGILCEVYVDNQATSQGHPPSPAWFPTWLTQRYVIDAERYVKR